MIGQPAEVKRSSSLAAWQSRTVNNPAQMQGVITGFHVGDTLALGGITTTTGVGPVPLDANDRLTVAGTGLVLQFDGAATGTVFTESVAGGQTTITALCFCPDTLIETPTGQVKVQELAVGDMVTTASGAVRPIVWVGTGQVLATRGRRGPATPVIIRKGAFAPTCRSTICASPRDTHSIWTAC